MSDYIRKRRCKECGEPHWFRYWCGRFCAKSYDGLCVGDFDLVFHRFKTVKDALGTRRVEHMMVVEVKVGDEKMNPPQRDTLSVFNGLLKSMIPVDGNPINVTARPGFIVRGDKKVVWHGVHILRVPVKECSVGPFFFNGERISSLDLSRVLNFENDPNSPQEELDIDRRHKSRRRKSEEMVLFS